MGRNTGVKVARGALYVIFCVVAVIIVVMLIIGAYYTAMNTMNVNMMVKDAFSKRAQAVLLPSADGSDRIMLEKLFTTRVLSTDNMLNSRYYDEFEIQNYYENSEVEFHIVWPWDEETTIEVTERVRDITGKKITDMQAEEDENAVAVNDKPVSWDNGVYEVTLKKDKVSESWKISELKLIEPIVIDETEPEPTVLPGEEPSAGASASPTPSASPSESPS